MLTTQSGTKVGSLEDQGDGTVKLRLHPRSKLSESDGTLVLEEPTARQYAELRDLMRAADRELDEKLPRPDPPIVPAQLTQADSARMLAEYTAALNKWNDERLDYMRNPGGPGPGDQPGPYARAVLEACRLLAKPVTIDDLTAEAFEWRTCRALLEVWEAPLGGRDDPGTKESTPAAESAPPEPSAPDSPAPEPSLLPGTEPASPSPPETSTE